MRAGNVTTVVVVAFIVVVVVLKQIAAYRGLAATPTLQMAIANVCFLCAPVSAINFFN